MLSQSGNCKTVVKKINWRKTEILTKNLKEIKTDEKYKEIERVHKAKALGFTHNIEGKSENTILDRIQRAKSTWWSLRKTILINKLTGQSCNELLLDSELPYIHTSKLAYIYLYG